MVRRFLFIVVASLSACAEPSPPPVDGAIIEAAVKHAQDQTDDARRRREAGFSSIVESEG
ncbi:MAG TPA: hypothetical protein VFO69_06540 [Allosphingosinicella sp.]|nr:hypothetical protein [Allosphingosinicella sp.]